MIIYLKDDYFKLQFFKKITWGFGKHGGRRYFSEMKSF